MTDKIKRCETVHIDEAKGCATVSTQWLLENHHRAGTHPMCNNSKLKVLICGEEGFGDIAAQIAAAKESIDLCCWGFDPGMELERAPNAEHWPRGKTYGELLVEAAARGVQVRLLVWHDPLARGKLNPKNIVGLTHNVELMVNRDPTKSRSKIPTPQQSLHDARAANPTKRTPVEEVVRQARADYCTRWIRCARNKDGLKGIELRMRMGTTDAVQESLSKEPNKPRQFVEKQRLQRMGTHHQKTILIDFFHQDGVKAIGYVMGLNSVTDYWDTTAHRLEDPRRELEHVKDRNGAMEKARAYDAALPLENERTAAKAKVERYREALKRESDPRKLMALERQFANALAEAKRVEKLTAFETVKPYRDYSCRIDGGRALVAVYNNFVKAWEREDSNLKSGETELGKRGMPAACLAKGKKGNPLIQIVRTQPDEQDKTVRHLYFQATDQAALAGGYMYLENQYFYWPEWTQHLLKIRKQVVKRWEAGAKAMGLNSVHAMPLLHIFIVIPVPERAEMLASTYETLAPLGQHEHLSGQSDMVDLEYKRQSTVSQDERGAVIHTSRDIPEVVQTAKKIDKPSLLELEEEYGIKVCTAMLNACGITDKGWDYREIYIHSKLLLIDDTFFTIGSANLNVRSMAVDSEMNVGVLDPALATDLRKRIWSQLSGGNVTGNEGTSTDIAEAFKKWKEQSESNRARQMAKKRIKGFILPLDDTRSSTFRLE